MSMLTGIIYGVFGTTLAVVLVIVLIIVLMISNRKKFNKMIRIKNWTAGKPKVETYFAQLRKHPKLGDVYYIPALKKQDRHYIQYFGSEFEYPTNKGDISYVPVTYFGKQYSPEFYSAHEKRENEVLELVDTVSKDGKPIKQWQKIKKEIDTFIIKPTKSSMRQFNLATDILIKDEYQIGSTWWDKYGMMVISLGMLTITMVVCVMMIIMTVQWGQDITGSTPDWVSGLMGALDSGQAPPTQ